MAISWMVLMREDMGTMGGLRGESGKSLEGAVTESGSMSMIEVIDKSTRNGSMSDGISTGRAGSGELRRSTEGMRVGTDWSSLVEYAG